MKVTKREIRLAQRNGKTNELYGQEVNRLIRERYGLSEELALLRKRDEEPEEFAAYNEYAEQCKVIARQNIYGIEVQDDESI